MKQTDVSFDDIRQTIRQIPVLNRLEAINDILVGEFEYLGYELAHVASPKTVSSVFVLASDTGSHVKSIRRQIEKEVIQLEPVFQRNTSTKPKRRMAS
ncbi:hypothetical protein [uncultured Tateyamaria sp.]|uniref:hypothetical protein n=1 Tax=uncultured Tateyamaria sp. TaxID=455651 RepID=UPI0026094BC7|nr:hypothetical protein [uncultured Tateyamaria sp.]